MDDLPVIKGSRIQLSLLFKNLLDNALKYHADDLRPKVTVSSSFLESNSVTVIDVNDNGIGIALQHQRRIIDMFKRLHMDEEYSGTDLGLAICNHV
ncbi:MAG: ATP-binding protein [Granulosicoccus sp.]